MYVITTLIAFTYQFNTRDTFSIACKATWAQVDGKPYDLFKDPITGKSKKSAKGLLQVYRDPLNCGKLTLKEQCTPEEENGGLLEVVFQDGQLMKEYTLSDIRRRMNF